MVRLIMGEKGTGKTKMLIELINSAAEKESGNVVCIEAKSALTFDVNHQVRLLTASEYQIADYQTMKGFVSGLYAGNYDISHIFIDNLLKIVDGNIDHEADTFLAWLERFSNKYGVKFTVSVSADPSLATEEMRTYL